MLSFILGKPTSNVYKPRLGDTIRYVEYDKVKPYNYQSMATFVRWHDTENIVVSIDGVEKVISAEYLI